MAMPFRRIFMVAIASSILSGSILHAQIQVRELKGEIFLVPAQGAEQPKNPKVEEKKNPASSTLSETFNQQTADRETLKSNGIEDDSREIVKFLRSRSATNLQLRKIQELIQKFGSEDFEERELASRSLLSYGLSSVGLLKQAERSTDPEIVRRSEQCLEQIEKFPVSMVTVAAIRRLADLKPVETTEVLIQFLAQIDDDSQATEIRRTLASVAMRDGKADPLMIKALSSPDLILRANVAEAFARGGDTSLREQMRKLAESETNLQIRLPVLLALINHAKDKLAVDLLLKNLDSIPNDSIWRIEEILVALSGENGPSVSLVGDAATRQKGAETWKNWWSVNRDKVDLAKLEETPKTLGYTMILEMDIRGIGGRIIELDANGKERWKMTGLQFPSDAQFLAGNRLLVVEHNASKVTERDLTGKELWSYQVMQPINATKQANGNYLIIARNVVMEINREQDKVTVIKKIELPTYDIGCGKRLRNGDLLLLTRQGMIVRLDKDGKLIKSFSVGMVNYWSWLDVLPNDRVLITGRTSILEFDLNTGNKISTIPFLQAGSVQRLANGNLLVTAQGQAFVSEIDRLGKSVWDYKPTDPNFRPWRAFRR
jgi:hypothetical protein